MQAHFSGTQAYDLDLPWGAAFLILAEKLLCLWYGKL